MARKAFPDELEALDPQVDEREEPAEEPKPQRRAARSKPAAEASSGRRRINLIYWTVPFAALVVAVLAILGFHRVEAYLINETKFRINAPSDFGQESPNLTIAGLHRTTREEVLKIFEQDFGRSIYLFPVAERRRNLLALPWIREATVSRRWPHQVVVTVAEREPVAFVQFERPNSAPSFRLVDADGVLLPVPKGERFDLVVLTGIKPSDIEPERVARVRRAAAMLKEIGPLAGRISEIDLSDPGNMRVSMRIQDTPVTALTGNREYRARLDNFLAHFDRIHQQRPDATSFDLRIDGRIIALNDRAAVQGESAGPALAAAAPRTPVPARETARRSGGKRRE